jgi:AcrR family transcriptional regulator
MGGGERRRVPVSGEDAPGRRPDRPDGPEGSNRPEGPGRPRGARRPAAETRERVLDVAHELFYWNGIRATGVDAIAREAGVAPTILYRLFGSKDGLIAAYVERAAAGYREWFDAAVGEDGDVLSVFSALEVQLRPENCRGCPFLMALAELPDPGHPAHEHAVAVKAWVRARFRELTDERTGDRLALVFEGAYASTQALGAAGPAAGARDLAAAVMPARTGGTGARSRGRSGA